jgi:hypothetical protein
MDRSWMRESNRCSERFQAGVEEFMRFAVKSVDAHDMTKCPCRDCANRYYCHISEVKGHLYMNGFTPAYTRWIFHGEEDFFISTSTNMHTQASERMEEVDAVNELFDDVCMGTFVDDNIGESSTSRGPTPDDHEQTSSFYRFWEDGLRELYPGCKKFTQIAFVLKMLHIKSFCNMSNKAFDMMIDLIKTALPDGETLPCSYREAIQFRRHLGFGYDKIHACKNGCVLFWKEHADKVACPKCNTSRWVDRKGKKSKIPQKVLRYFPIKSRLQRLFMTKEMANEMRWHKEGREDDGNTLRHPADSITWKEFDRRYEWFASDSRNVRLGLASDGFNPYGNMSTTYSIWAVMLTVYNLPPWMCMKSQNLMLSLIIPGPSDPGKNIDVYLRPLVDDLKDLWNEGIRVYDASKKETFQLHATLLWTINDFPAYGKLSGWATNGNLACPICNKDTSFRYLKYGRKVCFMCHRRWLPEEHPWRKRGDLFDGTDEHRSKPQELSTSQLLQQLRDAEGLQFGQTGGTKKKNKDVVLNWKKRSIFFELPYWSSLKLRHNLDVMHIEKNICESILGTLMNIEGKTKDTIKARRDLQLMGIRKELHVQQNGENYRMPLAKYTLTRDEKKGLCEWLKCVKFPDGYASNIGRCVNKVPGKISGMKSHDCHVFLQRLLPVAIRNLSTPEIRSTLTEFSNFFIQLCARTLKVDILKQMQDDIIIILCKMEKIFPPAFFDVMIHLALHLPREAELGGPVQTRWMYPFERELGRYKKWTRNKARPEGCIAECYLAEESLTFCSRYLRGIETRLNREQRNVDVDIVETGQRLDVFSQRVRPLGAAKLVTLDANDFDRARWYVLSNCNETAPYLE